MIVAAQSTGLAGRFIADIRTNHVVVDAGLNRGGTAEAPTPGEYFLAGIASCAVVVMTGEAGRLGLTPKAIHAEAEIIRNAQDNHSVEAIELRIATTGLTQAEAEALLQIYTDECPVYGVVNRGTALRITLTAK